MPLVAPPSLNDPLDARVTDDHALFSVIQDGNDARVIVGCLAQPRPSTPVAYHVGFKSVVLCGVPHCIRAISDRPDRQEQPPSAP